MALLGAEDAARPSILEVIASGAAVARHQHAGAAFRGGPRRGGHPPRRRGRGHPVPHRASTRRWQRLVRWRGRRRRGSATCARWRNGSPAAVTHPPDIAEVRAPGRPRLAGGRARPAHRPRGLRQVDLGGAPLPTRPGPLVGRLPGDGGRRCDRPVGDGRCLPAAPRGDARQAGVAASSRSSTPRTSRPPRASDCASRRRRAGRPVVAVVFDVPLERCLAQNAARPERQVPDAVVRRHHRELSARWTRCPTRAMRPSVVTRREDGRGALVRAARRRVPHSAWRAERPVSPNDGRRSTVALAIVGHATGPCRRSAR